MIWGLGAERGEVFRCTETDSVLQKRSRPASLAGVTGGTSGYACRQGCSKGITGRQWLLGPPASKPTEAATHNDQGVGAPLASLGSPWAEAMAALCGAQPFPAQTWPSLSPDKPLVCLPLLRELFSKIKIYQRHIVQVEPEVSAGSIQCSTGERSGLSAGRWVLQCHRSHP